MSTTVQQEEAIRRNQIAQMTSSLEKFKKEGFSVDDFVGMYRQIKDNKVISKFLSKDEGVVTGFIKKLFSLFDADKNGRLTEGEITAEGVKVKIVAEGLTSGALTPAIVPVLLPTNKTLGK